MKLAILSASILALSMANASIGHASARFTCHGIATETCYFDIVAKDGTRLPFTLKSGQTRIVDTAAPGVDRYMVSVNFAPPQRPEACSRQPTPEAKRSFWCKLATVNDAND
jgi:hypothetical protein